MLSLLLHCSALFNRTLKDLLFLIVQVIDSFLVFGLFVCEVFVFLFSLLLLFQLVLLHALSKLLLVVLLGHLTIQHEFLVQGVSQSDIRRQGAGRCVYAVVLDEAHCILAEDRTWLSTHLTIELLFAAQ